MTVGAGQYLLLVPALRGLTAMRLRLRGNPLCVRTLRGFTERILSRHARRIVETLDVAPRATQDDFLNGLSKVGRRKEACTSDAGCGSYKLIHRNLNFGVTASYRVKCTGL